MTRSVPNAPDETTTMANLEAAAVAHGGSLSRTHPHPPAIDVLDLVMKVRIDRVLDFAQPSR